MDIKDAIEKLEPPFGWWMDSSKSSMEYLLIRFTRKGFSLEESVQFIKRIIGVAIDEGY